MKALLRASGLASLGPVVPPPGDESRYDTAADALLGRGVRSAEIELVTLLRWLAQERGLLFHGSGRDDLTTLEPIRLTRDATPFGDQQAVYASSDPVWAMYFAVLRRGGGFRATRNGSTGIVGDLYPRWYLFSHNEEAETEGRFGDGWLYVLPPDGFRPEPSHFGMDYAHWVSPEAVTPVARIAVAATDFPFPDRIVPHRLDESMRRTFLRATWFGRVATAARARLR